MSNETPTAPLADVIGSPDPVLSATPVAAAKVRRTWTLREALTIARQSRVEAQQQADVAALVDWQAIQHGPAVACQGCGRAGRLGIDILGSGAEWLLCDRCGR